jgi:hypothetical protein
MEHIWILISWLINAVCGFVLFIYRNDTEKTAKAILIEKILISLPNLLAILDVPICCKVTTNTTNKDPIEEGKNLLSLISNSKHILELLKYLFALKKFLNIMTNKCANCGKKLVKHIWILISWLINTVCGIV